MKKNQNLAKNIAFGVLFGVIVGIILKNIGLWIGVGTMFGIARANYLSSQKKNKE
tara:strand:+ start:114 stop:278 length:165 start_codon:yes stop_codon:yes gene_type:complete